jgi:hypothetical protein
LIRRHEQEIGLIVDEPTKGRQFGR